MEEESYFEITDRGDYIRLIPIRFSNPNSDNLWDRKWIKTKVEVKGGNFQGIYLTELMIDEFKDLKRQLSKLYNNLNGSSDFNDLEGHLELKIKGDGIGHFEVKVIACDQPSFGSVLKFTLEFDQTQIEKKVIQLDKIISIFS